MCDVQVDELVDVIEGNRIYIPCLYILNKIDQITLEELEVIDRMENYVPICAYHEWNLDGVLECVWDKLNLTRCAGPVSQAVELYFGLVLDYMVSLMLRIYWQSVHCVGPYELLQGQKGFRMGSFINVSHVLLTRPMCYRRTTTVTIYASGFTPSQKASFRISVIQWF